MLNYCWIEIGLIVRELIIPPDFILIPPCPEIFFPFPAGKIENKSGIDFKSSAIGRLAYKVGAADEGRLTQDFKEQIVLLVLNADHKPPCPIGQWRTEILIQHNHLVKEVEIRMSGFEQKERDKVRLTRNYKISINFNTLFLWNSLRTFILLKCRNLLRV